MSYRFSPDRKSYIRSTGLLDQDGRNIVQTKPCPDEWRAFGRPFIFKGVPGYMGPKRTWLVDNGERKLSLTLFFPLRVLDGLKL